MDSNRRQFLIGAGISALLVGCQRATQTAEGLPGAYWPDVERPPVPQPLPGVGPEASSGSKARLGTPARPIARSEWARYGPRQSDINPMNGISRITIHHEGYKVVNFDSYDASLAHMELLRRSHAGKGWADIGYHYVIDRAGRVIEARDRRFQGAHVRDNNEHNLGIMCLGNFDRQSPTEAQLRSLADAVSYFRRKFGVAQNRIYTHREIVPTACPGKNMQPRIVAMRSSGAFA